MDPQCNGASLFIDLVLQVDGTKNRRIASKDNWGIRSSVIWFCEEFLVYLQFIYVFLKYVVSIFGEELCNVGPLRKVNMIWLLSHKSCLLSLLRSDQL